MKNKTPIIDARLRIQLIKICAAVVAVSAALTYWITHDRHMIARKIVVDAAPSGQPALDRNQSVYCPVCRENIPKKEDQE